MTNNSHLNAQFYMISIASEFMIITFVFIF